MNKLVLEYQKISPNGQENMNCCKGRKANSQNCRRSKYAHRRIFSQGTASDPPMSCCVYQTITLEARTAEDGHITHWKE